VTAARNERQILRAQDAPQRSRVEGGGDTHLAGVGCHVVVSHTYRHPRTIENKLAADGGFVLGLHLETLQDCLPWREGKFCNFCYMGIFLA
jgi:hypothetical protein